MANHSLQKSSTIKSIAKTIDSDRQTYQWFKYLLLDSRIKQRLSGSDENAVNYKTICFSSSCQNLLGTVIIIILLISILTLPKLLGALAAVLIIPLFILHVRKRKSVKQLALGLIQMDFKNSEVEKMTLYQIAEHYSRKHQFPSLVTYIYTMDNFYRIVLVLALFTAIFINPLESQWGIFAFVLAALGGVYFLTGSSLFFRLLQNKGNDK